MSTDDVVILTPVLLAAITALVGLRLTFRTAGTAHQAVFTPMVFSVGGALIGISVGMIWFDEPSQRGRVVIETGIPLVVLGASLGAAAGVAARAVYPRLRWGKTAAFVTVMMLLAGSGGAPMGWVACSVDPSDAPDFAASSTRWMTWGAAIGSGVGLLIAVPEILFRRRGKT